MSPQEQQLIQTVLLIRQFSPEIYDMLVRSLLELRSHYRDRAIGAEPGDMPLAAGFARGVGEITRLVVEAPAIHEAIQQSQATPGNPL